MRKLRMALACVLAVFILTVPVRAENYNAPRLFIWDAELSQYRLYEFTESRPIVRNDRMLVPLKSGILGHIGVSSYDPINKEITLKTKEHVISMYMLELDVYDKGIRCYISDVRSDYVDGEVYVPIAAFAESAGWRLEYDQNSYAAYLGQ